MSIFHALMIEPQKAFCSSKVREWHTGCSAQDVDDKLWVLIGRLPNHCDLYRDIGLPSYKFTCTAQPDFAVE